MASSRPSRRALVGTHVLVVDDDPDARRLLSTVLEYAGALVTVVASAADGIAVLQRVMPDIAVSAVGLPEQDGLMREIRRLPAYRGGTIPAIALTEPGAAYDLEDARTDGFQAHLSKPVDPRELSRTLAVLVRRPDAGRRGCSA